MLSKPTLKEIQKDYNFLIGKDNYVYDIKDLLKEYEPKPAPLISDGDLWVSKPTLTIAEIINFLNTINSWLYNKHVSVNGNFIHFASYLHKICKTKGINVIYMLALIQKEQGCLYKKTPPSPRVQSRILGYGMTESGDIPKYYGFVNQFNGAVWQLDSYRKNKKWKINKLEEKKIYDATPDGKTTYTPLTRAEKASLFYTPRYAALVTQKKCIKKIKEILKGMK